MATAEEIIVQLQQLSPDEKRKVELAIERERAERLNKLDEISKGKYAGKLSSVDEFIARKQEDIEIEDRRTGHLIK